ncbi:MAG TPA: hypothetical protein VMB83_12730 [Roseiarcus sp.]|nr:hypothetical protein [Roseiarcus sp.]
METQVTVVRLYLPAASHSAHKAQMEKVLRFLHDELHVHGLSTSSFHPDPGALHPQRYENVGEVLRSKLDPPTVVEFFDESAAATPIKRKLRELAPKGYVVSWQAALETDASQRSAFRALTTSGG